MSPLTGLQFDFSGRPFTFPVEEVEAVQSPYTGRELRKLKTVVTVSPQDAAQVKDLLATSPVADSEGSLWSGNLDMESYTNDGPHSVTITWNEAEHLHADTIEFEGLILTPTESHYEERLNEDGSIAIAFQSTLTEEKTDRLRSLLPTKRSEGRYWSVIRPGVSDEPRSMHLGRVLWQQLHDKTIGHDITLVDEAFDSSDTSNSFLGLAGEPQVGNIINQVSALLAQFETLLTELEATEAVAPEAIERVRASADSLGVIRRQLFFEVSDLSKW